MSEIVKMRDGRFETGLFVNCWLGTAFDNLLSRERDMKEFTTYFENAR